VATKPTDCVVATASSAVDDYVDVHSINQSLQTNGTWNSSVIRPCPSYGSWPVNQSRTGTVRGFASNGRDVTFQSCSSNTSGSNIQFIFYTRDIDVDHYNVRRPACKNVLV